MSINMMQVLDVSKYPDLAQKINETLDNAGARIVSDYAEIVELGLKCGLLYKRTLPPDQVGVHRKNRDGAMVCGRESSQIWDDLDRVGVAPDLYKMPRRSRNHLTGKTKSCSSKDAKAMSFFQFPILEISK